MEGEGGGWLVRGVLWKLEFSRKSKCVGAKVRALTVLGGYRAGSKCQDLTKSRILTLLLMPWDSCVTLLDSVTKAECIQRLKT